ncbi:MAG: hypothetical protein NZ733_03140 [Aigarchaeota archaeon]|nr:hypothetical protein [Aigarchaeota archaeon]MCS7127569.1 hypothetical protein [Candidatus Calditenuaceae archaeon]MCX8203262.1 hypothetical protein [Nitrososphaeria archaeon]MDW8043490.1 hypothetical protein [Nitrososphaerota archaeon]
MSRRPRNAVVALLAKSRRYLTDEDVIEVLHVLAHLKREPFSLRDLRRMLPESVASRPRVARSVTNLLNTLINIGYLEKYSERKYRKLYDNLSIFLLSQVMELSAIENAPLARKAEESVLKQLKRTKAEGAGEASD